MKKLPLSLMATLFCLGCQSLADIPDETTCYSPTQNLDIAYEEGAEGCSCDEEQDEDLCVGGAALACEQGYWIAVNDGPCAPDVPLSDTESSPVTYAWEYFYQTWHRSYEEETDPEQHIYRPANFKEFPGSLYRKVYTFNEDGTCEWLVLDPADAHYMASGTYRHSEFYNVISIEDDDGAYVETISVWGLTENQLILFVDKRD